MAEAVEDAFRYGKIILAASTYNMSVFPPMRQFLTNLKERKCMKEILEQMKEIEIVEPTITIKSKMKDGDIEKLEQMANAILL